MDSTARSACPFSTRGRPAGSLSAEGEIDATPERIEVKAVNGAAAGASFTGSGTLGLAGERWSLKAASTTGRLSLTPILALILLPRDGEPPSAGKPFGPALADAVDLDLALATETLSVLPGLTFKAARFAAKGTPSGLDLTVEGEAVPGHRSALAGTIARDGKGFRVNGTINLDAELATLLLGQDRLPALRGEARLDAKFTATGLSIGGLFAAMDGEGTLALDSGVLRGVDPVAFAGGIETARTPAEIDQLVDGVLSAGALRFTGGSTRIAMQAGVISSEPLAIAGEDTEGRLKLVLDTAAAEADVSAALTLQKLAGKPSFEVAWAGPPEALQASYDVSGLKSTISVGALSKGIDKLEELQREQERIVAEEQAYALDQAITITERARRRQAREAAARAAIRQAEEAARIEAERQARLIAEAEARAKVDEQRRRIDEAQRKVEEEKKKRRRRSRRRRRRRRSRRRRSRRRRTAGGEEAGGEEAGGEEAGGAAAQGGGAPPAQQRAQAAPDARLRPVQRCRADRRRADPVGHLDAGAAPDHPADPQRGRFAEGQGPAPAEIPGRRIALAAAAQCPGGEVGEARLDSSALRNSHTRTALDRLRGPRSASIAPIRLARLVDSSVAARCRASQNSDLSDRLVRWPANRHRSLDRRERCRAGAAGSVTASDRPRGCGGGRRACALPARGLPHSSARSALVLPNRVRFSAAAWLLRSRSLRLRWRRRLTISAIIRVRSSFSDRPRSSNSASLT